MSNEIALMREIAILQNQIDALRTIQQGWQPVFLSSPLTSTSWDGDSFSTTAKTLIDLSAVFSAPAGIKAISVFVRLNDSASASANYWMVLSPVDTANVGIFFQCSEINDRHRYGTGIIPCDANGDIYYQISASGANTLDALIRIVGYWR